MSRAYVELATGRRAVLLEFHRGQHGRPAQYIMAWADTRETFQLDGRRVLREFEHVVEEVKVEVGKQ